MDLLESIKRDVLKLDETWFLDKKRAFQAHPQYDKVLERINLEYDVDDGYEDDQGVWHDEVRSVRIDKDLESFCFDDFIPFSDNPHLHKQKQPANLSDVIYSIKTKVNLAVAAFKEAAAVYALNQELYSLLQECVEVLKMKCSDPSYHQIIERFLSKTFAIIDNEVSSRIVEYTFANSKAYLDFDLQQNELLSLIFILKRAGFFHGTSGNDNAFLLFCHAHFRFRKGDKFLNTKALKTFQTKFSGVSAGDSVAALNKVIEKLEAAISDMKSIRGK